MRKLLVAGMLLGILVLAVSRSVLSPDALSNLAPAIAGVLVLAGASPWMLQFRHPPGLILLCGLLGLLVFATGMQGVMGNFVTAGGMCMLWLASLYVAANMTAAEQRAVLLGLLCLAGVQILIAVLETLAAWDPVRQLVAAEQGGGYAVRENTILGPWTNRAQGTIGYPVPFGTLMVIGAMAGFFDSAGKRGWIRYLLLAAFLGGALLSGSRSAVLGVFVGLAVGLIYRLRSRFTISDLLLLAAGAAGAAAFTVLATGRDGFASHDSFVHRAGVLESASALLAGRPLPQVLFGTGYNSHESLYDAGFLIEHGTRAVDNTLMTVFIQTGLLGLALFLLLLGTAMRRGSARHAAILAAMLGTSLFYDLTNWHLMGMLLFTVAGFCLDSGRTMQKAAPERELSRQKGLNHGA